MTSEVKSIFLQELSHRCGELYKLADSHSLFQIPGSNIRIYIRYSRLHNDNRTWYGLRERDFHELEGCPSIICFLWEGQEDPLLIPYSDFEDVFQSTSPADDGQYKVQIILHEDGTELYIPRVGRFNVEGYIGWRQLDNLLAITSINKLPDLSHSQIQTLLGSIGSNKSFDIWIPSSDRSQLDWMIAQQFDFRDILPYGYEQVKNILQEVDVIWLRRGSNDIHALFEVEYSTPIYGGLLRFNDIHLITPNLHPRFSIVANNTRRSLFIRQLNRPTFRMSGLSELCTFLEYADVFNWYSRLIN